MPVHWDRSECKNWDNVPISAQSLAMALWGYNSGWVTITEENYKDIAKYIFEKQLFRYDNGYGNPVELEKITQWCKDAIGFKRSLL